MNTRFYFSSGALFKRCFLLVCLFVLLVSKSFAQGSASDMVTYDTVFTTGSGSALHTWTLRITRPIHMFTPNHKDTASRPAIITMPGMGEVGTNAANLQTYGPHFWLNNGWNGGVVLGNGTHYPILVTVIVNHMNVRPTPVYQMMTILLNKFKIKRNAVHVGGLSMGGMTWGRFLSHAPSQGDESYMRMITSFTALQGVANDLSIGYNHPGWSAFGVWAQKYNGKFFGLEGTNDGRGVWNIKNAMNAVAPTSAYFAYENFGSGTHCCWNDMYNPNKHDFVSVGSPLGRNITTAAQPNAMGTYKDGSSIFQWMLRQGDTTLPATSNQPSQEPPLVVNPGSQQNITATSTTLNGSASLGSIIRQTWSQVSGPNTANIVSPSNITTNVSGLVNGTYVFRLTINSILQVSVGQVTVIKTSEPNTAPVVSVITDQIITLPTDRATLVAQVNDDDATGLTYRWEQVSGPNTGNFVNATNISTDYTGLIAGSYNVRFTATDREGLHTSRTFAVIVNPPSSGLGEGANSNPKTIVGLGEYQTFFIDSDKHLWGLGNISNIGTNGQGTPGIPRRIPVTPFDLKFKAAIGGLHGGGAVDENGYVWVFGDNDQGQHGQGDVTHPILYPRKIERDSAGNLFNRVVTAVGYFVKTSDGGHNGFFAVKDDGTLWVWGRTLAGMRGNGTDAIESNSNTRKPVQIFIPGNRRVKQIVAGNFAIALCTDGTVWTWGRVANNNLGYAATGMDYASPHQLTGLSNITQIAGSGSFNYALASNGQLYGWGHNGNQMGDLTYPSGNGQAYPTPRVLVNIMNKLPLPIKKIVTNTVSTHVILEDGSLYGWGVNAEGTVGIGKERNWKNYSPQYAWDFTFASDEIVKVPTLIAPTIKFEDVFGSNVYTFYTYAIDKDGQLYCWGRNKASVLAGQIRSANGTITALRQSAWNRTWPTPVNPFEQTASYISTSPDCVDGTSTGSPCSTYGIPTNTRPVANAGSNQGITGTSVKLDGTKSTDNVFISYYEWKQVSGPNAAVIDLPASKTPTVSNLITGVYTFRLKVVDNGWLSDSTEVTISVNASGNQSPTVSAGNNVSITLPINTVTLTGTASDADGTITSVQWRRVSGPASFNIVSPSELQTVINGLTQGVYSFELRATDNSGASSVSTVSVTVNAAPNQAPTVNAGNNVSITLPTNSVTLNGTASDPDGTIVSVQWRKVSGPAGLTIVSPTQLQTVINGLTQGVYSFELTATDNSGATAKATVTVTVNAARPAANIPPVADAGQDIEVTLPENSATLEGSATDVDGTIVLIQWRKISGPVANIVNATAYKTEIVNLELGTYEFELTVTDNNGATGKDTVSVLVNQGKVDMKLVLYPNPVSTQEVVNLSITSSASHGTGMIMVADAKGVFVLQKNYASAPGVVTEKINVAALPKGIYFIQVRVENEVSTIKLVKQ